MAYTITKETGLDPEEYGYTTRYSIDFTFERQKANVTIEINEDSCRAHLCSNTDGYHWLQFWLSHEPKAGKLSESLCYDEEVDRCRLIFRRLDVGYEQEDKETAFLFWHKDFDLDFAKMVADVIEPRFALRERFFPD